MEYEDINQLVNEHFSSFDRLNTIDRKVSIIQSTRIILSIIKFKILKEVNGSNLIHLKELFKTLDTSLNYIIAKDPDNDRSFYENNNYELDMKSDTKSDMKSDISDRNEDYLYDEDENEDDENEDDENEEKNDEEKNDDEKDEVNNGGNPILMVNKKSKKEIITDDSSSSSSSLNSIYSVSLNTPKIKKREIKSDKAKGKEPVSNSSSSEKGEENDEGGGEENDEGGGEENDVLFSKSYYPYIIDKLQRIDDEKFHALLASLSRVGFFTHAPYKLYRMLKHHSSFFKNKNDVLTCSVYSLIVSEGHADILFNYFGFS